MKRSVEEFVQNLSVCGSHDFFHLSLCPGADIANFFNSSQHSVSAIQINSREANENIDHLHILFIPIQYRLVRDAHDLFQQWLRLSLLDLLEHLEVSEIPESE